MLVVLSHSLSQVQFILKYLHTSVYSSSAPLPGLLLHLSQEYSLSLIIYFKAVIKVLYMFKQITGNRGKRCHPSQFPQPNDILFGLYHKFFLLLFCDLAEIPF